MLCFEKENDARRVLRTIPKRFEKYGLSLHPEKTKLIQFREPRGEGNSQRPGVFDLLGFTHHWGKSRNRNWVVKTKTSKSRFSRGLKTLNRWCQLNRHKSIPEQHNGICQKLRGHLSYFGIPGNSDCICSFVHFAGRIWKKWLDRRSSKRHMNWARFADVLKMFPLPRPVIVHHSFRFVANP